MRNDESTSTTLLARVKGGDEDAWRRVIRLYGPLVLYWCRRSGLQEADRQDVFQEVFGAAARSISRFRRERSSGGFRCWLRKITENKLRDRFRKRLAQGVPTGGTTAYQQLLEIPGEASLTADGPVDSEENLLLRQALRLVRDEFVPRTWQAFWRSAADGISTAVVADQLNMTPAAVRKAKSRVLQRLREELGDLENWPPQDSRFQPVTSRQEGVVTPRDERHPPSD